MGTSGAASKKLTRLLTKEDKEALRRKSRLEGREQRVRAEEAQAESLADSALTDRDIRDIVDSIHETHLDTNKGGAEVPRAKGLFNTEQKRLKEEDKVAENLQKAIDSSLDLGRRHSANSDDLLQHSRREDPSSSNDFFQHLLSLGTDSGKEGNLDVHAERQAAAGGGSGAAVEELLKEYERWKHLKGISPA